MFKYLDTKQYNIYEQQFICDCCHFDTENRKIISKILKAQQSLISERMKNSTWFL